MGRRKTHEEFVSEMLIKHPNIEVLSEYETAYTRIKCRCCIDGYVWETDAHTLLKGNGCPRCSGKERYTNEQFLLLLSNIHPNIEVLSDYKGNQGNIKCRCNLDGYEWSATANHLLMGSGCPKCGNVATKDTETFISEMQIVNKNIKIIGKYYNNKTKIKCECLIDGNIWSAIPNSLLRGKGCPVCRQSKGELRIFNYLELRNLIFNQQCCFEDCINIKPLPFDFYLPDKNIAIEYDGEQHYYPVKFAGKADTRADERFLHTKHNDFIKSQYCKRNNIKLIRIPYTEFEEIENILDKLLF